MSDLRNGEEYSYYTEDTGNNSLEQIIQKNFETFYLFHEIFSEPVCRRMNPLFALYPWKPQIMRMFHK